MSKPLVSIGFPVFNGAASLRRTLDSLLAQTYSEIEIIISDNASTDNTSLICENYAKTDSRIRYFKQQANIGAMRNFQFVFLESQGQYFMWAADDDWWHPDFILRLKDVLDRNPEYGLAMCSLRSIEKKDKDYRFIGANDLTNLDHYRLFHYIASGIGRNKAPALMYGLFRRQLLERFSYRPFIVDCKGPDRLLLSELALATKVYTLPDILWAKGHASDERRRTGRKIYKGDRYIHSFYRYAFLIFRRILTSRNISAAIKISVLLRHYPKLVWNIRHYFIYRDLRSFRFGREILRRR